jgi:hypothetical protein
VIYGYSQIKIFKKKNPSKNNNNNKSKTMSLTPFDDVPCVYWGRAQRALPSKTRDVFSMDWTGPVFSAFLGVAASNDWNHVAIQKVQADGSLVFCQCLYGPSPTMDFMLRGKCARLAFATDLHLLVPDAGRHCVHSFLGPTWEYQGAVQGIPPHLAREPRAVAASAGMVALHASATSSPTLRFAVQVYSIVPGPRAEDPITLRLCHLVATTIWPRAFRLSPCGRHLVLASRSNATLNSLHLVHLDADADADADAAIPNDRVPSKCVTLVLPFPCAYIRDVEYWAPGKVIVAGTGGLWHGDLTPNKWQEAVRMSSVGHKAVGVCAGYLFARDVGCALHTYQSPNGILQQRHLSTARLAWMTACYKGIQRRFSSKK